MASRTVSVCVLESQERKRRGLVLCAVKRGRTGEAPTVKDSWMPEVSAVPTYAAAEGHVRVHVPAVAGSVLISTAHVSIKGHADVRDLRCHLKPC